MGRRNRGRHRPSEAARHRLADALRSSRAELEVQVAEGLLRSELFLETGRPDEAAEVLAEQRRRVLAFEGDVRDALAAAAVEAETEAVLAGASGVEVLHDDRVSLTRGPQLVAASLAALVGLTFVTLLGVTEGDDSLRAAVRIDATDELVSEGLDTERPRTPERLRLRGYGTVFPHDELGAVAAPDHGATRRWLAEQDTMLERLGLDPQVRTRVLRNLEGLVAQLDPGTPLTDAMWLQVLSAAVAETEGATEDDGDAGTEARSEDGSERPSRGWIGPERRKDTTGPSDEDPQDEQPQEEQAEAPTAPTAPAADDAPDDGDDEAPPPDGQGEESGAPGSTDGAAPEGGQHLLTEGDADRG